MFSPGEKSNISSDDKQDSSDKVEIEVSTNVPQGGDTSPYSSSEVHFKESNSNILSSEALQAIDIYSIACDRPRRTIRQPAHYTTNDESGLIAYALVVAHEIPEGVEPSTYSEAISYPNSSNCAHGNVRRD